MRPKPLWSLFFHDLRMCFYLCLCIANRDEWIPLFSDIRILGYHGYLDTMDTWISWILGYHGYLDISTFLVSGYLDSQNSLDIQVSGYHILWSANVSNYPFIQVSKKISIQDSNVSGYISGIHSFLGRRSKNLLYTSKIRHHGLHLIDEVSFVRTSWKINKFHTFCYFQFS